MGKKSVKKSTSFKGKSNPFNIQQNREKYSILGKDVRGTKGFRSITKAEGMAKRKEALQRKKKVLSKANNFWDKRDKGDESSEEISTKRFVQERKQKLKKTLFNLNEEDFLTHDGVPVKDIEQFDKKTVSDDEDDHFSSAYVERVHFGNFAPQGDRKPYTGIDDDVIAQSKLQKYEQKKERDENSLLIDKLDADWKNFSTKNLFSKKSDNVPIKGDNYDSLTQQLKFSARGKATTRTKTDAEIEDEALKKSMQLERERVERMNDCKIRKFGEHFSADGLIDEYDEISEETQESAVKNQESEPDDSFEPNNESDDVDEDSNEETGNANVKSKSESEDSGVEFNLNFNIPDSIEKLKEYMSRRKYNSDEVHIAVDELLTPVLNSKSEKKLVRLAKFFRVLIEYSSTNSNVAGKLLPCICTTAKLAPLKTAEVFLSLLDESNKAFQEHKQKKKKCNISVEKSILLFKYCGELYSVSDFRHPVVTPSLIFMCDILSSPYVITYINVVSRLMICDIILTYTAQSRRLVPEVINFLNNTLRLAVPTNTKKEEKYKENKKLSLILNEKQNSLEVIKLNIMNSPATCNDSVKLNVISNTIYLLLKFTNLYKTLISFSELFSETYALCSKLPHEYYPLAVRNTIKDLMKQIRENKVPLRHLTFPNKKPKPLKLFEPRFDSKYTATDDIRKKFHELKKVSQKIRKEERGQLREMRRDTQVIAAEKLKEQLESDAERKRKVKALYRDLATQEGEYKKLMKKSKKF